MKPKTKAFPFMRLPVELRAEIYDYVFPRGEEIKVVEKSRVGIKTRLRRQEGLKAANTKAERGSTLTTNIRWQRPSGLSLLHVSKQILNEAAPVAYGNPVLVCPQHYVGTFLKEVGSMRKHLKYLRLSAGSGPDVFHRFDHLRANLHNLGDALDLRSLTLDHELVCAQEGNRPSDEQKAVDYCTKMLAHALWPTVKTLSAQKGQIDHVLQLVRIQHPQCRCKVTPNTCPILGLPCQFHCGHESMDGHLSGLEEKVHTSLRQRYDIVTENLRKIPMVGNVVTSDKVGPSDEALAERNPNIYWAVSAKRQLARYSG
jgi:hypothetical protein